MVDFHRPEAIAVNAVYLAGTEESSIYEITTRLLIDTEFHKKMTTASCPFGDGQASRRIVSILSHFFGFVSVLPVKFKGSLQE
ncbi:UDP-N-acetylglucosamine 2-epimerase [Paenibacillus mangrovi]|uniref:UDP-N-acetylglucosamine 2-epimerase n=1 Tax=Paenibacillus mangrovi TaxID=2931978 RepID=UPI003CC80503